MILTLAEDRIDTDLISTQDRMFAECKDCGKTLGVIFFLAHGDLPEFECMECYYKEKEECLLCGLKLVDYPHKIFHNKSVCHNCLKSINESELIG